MLALNYFGVRTGDAWQAWRKDHEDILLIEDHTHDPLSSWVRNSQADYALASTCKTFPLSDGALLWSPAGRSLPPEPRNNNWSGSGLRLAVMHLKRDYLARGEPDRERKHVFRSLYAEGERIIMGSPDVSVSPWSHALLQDGYPERWRQQREDNVSLFLELIAGHDGIEPLFTTWPEGRCPFNPVLLFPSQTCRDRFRSRLIEADIYTPVHRLPGLKSSPRVQELSARILTIPLDQRYDSADIHRIFAILSRIEQNHHEGENGT